MYNPNFGYSPASSSQQSFSTPYSSTPSNVRPSRPPRFGYPGPSAYPRPRSSASKPNPEGYLESDRERYGNADEYMDDISTKYPASEYGDSYEDQYPESEGYAGNQMRNNYRFPSEGYMNSSMQSIYGNVSDNNLKSPLRSNFGGPSAYVDVTRGTTDSMVNNYGNTNDHNMDISFSSMNNSSHSQNSTAYFTCNESFYESPKKPLLGNSLTSTLQYSPSQSLFRNAGYNTDQKVDFQGRFRNKKDKFKAASSLATKSKSIYGNRRGPGKKNMATKSEWRCTVCSIEFTSGIPYDMHLRGAKHAKKLKLQSALQLIQSQVAQTKEIAPVGNSFRCDLCNITANSSLQLQTHLDGTKHKNKLLKQQNPQENKTEEASEGKKSDNASKVKKPETVSEAKPEVNGKSNGTGVVRPLPTEFGEPQQAKMCKFSCDICNLILNSEIQLQQHLTSKKHEAKVEGKPYPKRKFKKKKDDDENGEKTDNGTEVKTDDNATEGCVATETTTQESATVDTSETESKKSITDDARKMVVGVKTLSSSFVQGGNLQ